MRFQVLPSALILIVLLLYGCDSNQYQAVTGPDGTLYRFDKKMGTLSVIMKDKKMMQPTESGKERNAKKKHDPALEKPVSWKESKYPGKDLKAKFEMVWREKKLCYKLSVYPYKSLEKVFARKKQDYIYSLMRPGFTVELLDKNGFLVKDIKVNLWSMNKIDNENGITKELVLNSQIECSRQSYRSIGGCTIKWALESEMIEDDVGDYIKSSPIKSER